MFSVITAPFRWVWRGFKWGLILLFLALVFLLARHAIARAAADWLIAEDMPTAETQVVFVLSGRPAERGAEAAELAKRFPKLRIVCTGGLAPDNALALGFADKEAHLTQRYLVLKGINPKRIELMPVGTSTREEVLAIARYTQRHKLDRIAVLSSRLHTRRIRSELQSTFGTATTVEWAVWGAPARQFVESAWWESEDGLLFVTNEYIKLVYYWLT